MTDIYASAKNNCSEHWLYMCFFSHSGKGFFDRFKRENSYVMFPSPAEVLQCYQQDIAMFRWNAGCDEYILDQQMHRFPSDKECIFMVESHKLQPIEGSRVAFHTVVKYLFCTTQFPSRDFHPRKTCESGFVIFSPGCLQCMRNYTPAPCHA